MVLGPGCASPPAPTRSPFLPGSCPFLPGWAFGGADPTAAQLPGSVTAGQQQRDQPLALPGCQRADSLWHKIHLKMNTNVNPGPGLVRRGRLLVRAPRSCPPDALLSPPHSLGQILTPPIGNDATPPPCPQPRTLIPSGAGGRSRSGPSQRVCAGPAVARGPMWIWPRASKRSCTAAAPLCGTMVMPPWSVPPSFPLWCQECESSWGQRVGPKVAGTCVKGLEGGGTPILASVLLSFPLLFPMGPPGQG